MKIELDIFLPAVEEFIVAEFYRNCSFLDVTNDFFKDFVLASIQDTKLTLAESSLYREELFWNPVPDSTNLLGKQVIPIKKLLCQLKIMIEMELKNQFKFFNSSGKDNVFYTHSDVKGANIFVFVNVFKDKYEIWGGDIDAGYFLEEGDLLFSP